MPKPRQLQTVVDASVTEQPQWMPWPLLSFLSGVAVALVGWLVCTGLATIAWFGASSTAYTAIVGNSTGVWLLAHGVPFHIGETTVTLIPLGLSALQLWLLALTSGAVLRSQVKHAAAPGHSWVVPLRIWALTAAGYLAFALVLALVTSAALFIAIAGVIALTLCGCALGARHYLAHLLPRVVNRSLAGAGAGLLTMLGCGAVLLTVATLLGWNSMDAMEAELGIDAAGSPLFVAETLAWLPNALIYGISFLLGAGFMLGPDTLVTLSGVQIGFLPALPTFGALPEPGIQPSWLMLLLATGIVVGAVSALVAVRSLLDEDLIKVTLVSGLAGLLTSAFLLALGWLASGDLGADRMAGFGPRLFELMLVAPILLTLSSAATGLLRWFLYQRRQIVTEEATTQLRGEKRDTQT
ncbi:MAG: DUF6350 family protein [Propionibacteriaceae bacterium]|jgi:hypothetical protein|nr:DUF6350 family protein [Propionibacteriaceae bacterium]